MGRLIDVDKFAEYLSELYDKYTEKIEEYEMEENTFEASYLDIHRELLINILLNLKHQPTVNDWIPCSKQMPKRTEEGYYKTVLVTIKKEKQPCMGVWRDDCKQWWVRRNNGETLYSVNNNVVAWQYLPQTYKGE